MRGLLQMPREELNTISNTYNVTFKHHRYVRSGERSLAEQLGRQIAGFYVMADSIPARPYAGHSLLRRYLTPN